MSNPFTAYPRPMRATAVVSVSFTNQHFCMAIVATKRGAPRFYGSGSFDVNPNIILAKIQQ